MDDVVCIKDIFPLFPGETPEERTDRMQALSTTFYQKIWHGLFLNFEFYQGHLFHSLFVFVVK
jgi:hypothetical protein